MMRNKTFYALLPLLTLAAMVRADDKPVTDPADAPESDAKVPADFVQHAVGDSGVTIKTPPAWTAGKPTTASCKLMLLTDDKKGSFNVVQVINDGTSLPDIVKQLPDVYKTMFKDVKVEKVGLIKLDGKPAVRIVYTANISGMDLKLCQIFISKENKKGDPQFVITYSAPADDFDAIVPACESAAVSIKFP